MKIKHIILIAILTIQAQAQTGAGGRFILVGGEEFNSSGLVNPDDWWDDTHGARRGSTDSETYLQHYPNSSYFDFTGSKMMLWAREEPVWDRLFPWKPDTEVLDDGLNNLRWFPYSAATLRTKQAYKHCFFEIECDLPWGKGYWPSFWLYGLGGGGSTDEIDIFEGQGAQAHYIKANLHCNSGCKGSGQCTIPFKGGSCSRELQGAYGNDFTAGMNKIGLDWTQGGDIRWYVNGNLKLNYHKNFGYRMDLSAGLSISDGTSWDGPPNHNTPIPNQYGINYIRVYKRIDCNEVKTVCYNSTDFSQPTNYTGKSITFSCGFVKGRVNSWDWKYYLKAFATEEIVLSPGFHAERGSEVLATIVGCPAPKRIAAQPIPNDQQDQNSSLDIDFEVYPNPGVDLFSLKGIPDGEAIVSIIGMQGSTLYSENKTIVGNTEINLKFLPVGVYTIRVLLDDQFYSTRLIKE